MPLDLGRLVSQLVEFLAKENLALRITPGTYNSEQAFSRKEVRAAPYS